jgi:hypothetical protein
MKYKLFKIDKRYKEKRAYLIFDVCGIGVREIRFTTNKNEATIFDKEDTATQGFVTEYIRQSAKFKFTQDLQPPYTLQKEQQNILQQI